MSDSNSSVYPCPCCGFVVFKEQPGSYDICDVCGWEDDPVQLRYPLVSGANPPLIEEQHRFLSTLTQDALAELRARGLTRCPDWRPLNATDVRHADIGPRTGLDYFTSATSEPPPYYWRVERAE